MTLIYRKELTATYHGGFVSYKIPIVEAYGGEKPCILMALNLSKLYGKPAILEDLWYIIRKLRNERITGKITFTYLTRRFNYHILERVLNISKYDVIIEVLFLGMSYPYIICFAHDGKCNFRIPKLYTDRSSKEFLKKVLMLASEDRNDVTYMVYVPSSAVKVNEKNSTELNYEAVMNILKTYGLLRGSLEDLMFLDEKFKKVKILASRSKGGVVLLRSSVGQVVSKGTVVFEVRNIFGELVDSVESTEEGVIVSCTEKMFVKPYDYVMSIAAVQ